MIELKSLLLQAPDGQLDSSLFPLIEEWSDPPKAIEILEVLDKVIYSSLGSGFTVNVLQLVYNETLQKEGKTHDEMIPLAVWRKGQ